MVPETMNLSYLQSMAKQLEKIAEEAKRKEKAGCQMAFAVLVAVASALVGFAFPPLWAVTVFAVLWAIALRPDSTPKNGGEHSIMVIGRWIAFEQRQRAFWLELEPMEFEIETSKLLEKDGFNVKVTSYSGDGGVDIWAWRNDDDRVKMAVQCKHYRLGKAGVGAVRELIGAMKINDSRVGLLICTNGFTAGAHKLAGENKIILWDIEEVLLRANRDS